ncbi:MAG TPA: hypothetical protein VKI41_17535 [Vicinamibacteria bacterium]|nr:hypothetical protein [Vicinamibacteria bacterium]
MITQRLSLFLAVALTGGLAVATGLAVTAHAGARTPLPPQPAPIQWGQVRMTDDGVCAASIAGSRDWSASGSCVIDFAAGVNTTTSAFLVSSPDTLGTSTHVKVERNGHTATISVQGGHISTLDFALIHY